MKRWLRPSLNQLLVVIVLGVFLAELGSLDNLLYPPGSRYSDLMLTHWPNAHFMRQAVLQDHVWPLWNPTQLSGVPFAANPLSGLYYPPNWLFLVLPITPAFNLLLALHLCLGGLGMMRLVRYLLAEKAGPAGSDGSSRWRLDLSVREQGALVAGLAWALAPRIWAHLGAGHVGLVYAAGWLPWVIMAAVDCARHPRFSSLATPDVAPDIVGALDQGYRSTGQRSPPAEARWSSVCFSFLPASWALQFLADARLAAYTAAAVAALALWWITGQWRAEWPTATTPNLKHGRPASSRPPRRSWRLYQSLPPWLLAGALALALAAIQWLPLLDHLPYTRRGGLTSGETAVLSLPPSYLMGLLWANRGGFHEWMTYVGVSVLVLALLGWLTLRLRARFGMVLGLALLVLFALGDNGPLYPLLANLPGLTLLRVPPRVWFLVSFVAALLAGLGASALADGGRGLAGHRRGLTRSAVAVVGLVAFLALGVCVVNRTAAGAPLAATFWLLLALLSCALPRRWAWPPWAAGGLLALLVAAELVWMDASLVATRPAQQLFSDGRETAAVVVAETEGRVYAPSFRPPPQVAAAVGIRMVNGVEPLALANYAAFLGTAAGVPADGGYAVTLPPLREGEPDASMALADAVPSPWLLAALDVDIVVSQFPLGSPAFEELLHHDGERLTVYRNRPDIGWPAVFQRVESVPDFDAALAWMRAGTLDQEAVVTGGRSLFGPAGHVPAELVHLSPNRLLVTATGPGLLVLSEVFHPGWQATVDGEPAEIVEANGVLRGVYLGEGIHRVEMVYRPWAVTAGAILSLAALAFWLVGRVVARVPRRACEP